MGPALQGVIMALAVSVGIALTAGVGARRLPVVTLIMALLVCAGFVIQVAIPGTLEAFQRDGQATEAGEWLRLLTALFLQDGGMAGFGFNLLGLALIGALAEQRVSRPAWGALYFGPAVIAGIIALDWQPVGAGNSVAWMGLAGALFAMALRSERQVRLLVPGALGLALGAILVAKGNIHGPPVLIGAFLVVWVS